MQLSCQYSRAAADLFSASSSSCSCPQTRVRRCRVKISVRRVKTNIQGKTEGSKPFYPDKTRWQELLLVYDCQIAQSLLKTQWKVKKTKNFTSSKAHNSYKSGGEDFTANEKDQTQSRHRQIILNWRQGTCKALGLDLFFKISSVLELSNIYCKPSCVV